MQSRSVLFLPIGAILVSAVAAIYPPFLMNYGGAIVPMLGIVMFSMGLTLKTSDFVRVFNEPKLIFIGVSLQYILMPLIAWLLSILLSLPLLLMAGFVLLGACPGGTASNVICFLARGNLALSISLTAISTLLAVILTPLVTYIYVDQSINVPILSMMKNLLLIVVLPVVAGVLVNAFWHKRIESIKSFLPWISVISIIFIIGVIVAKNQEQLVEVGVLILLTVVLHNILGLIAGFYIPKFWGYDVSICKTVAIEVGMQNSGLAVVLANQYFSSLAALPGALFSIWHNISGAFLAMVWSKEKTNRKVKN